MPKSELTEAQKAIKKAERDALENAMIDRMAQVGDIPSYMQQYQFWEGRKYAFDFAWVEWRVAVEVEGGTYTGGRHTRGAGYHEDCLKYNQATLLGWRVYRFDAGMVRSGEAAQFMSDVFKRMRVPTS